MSTAFARIFCNRYSICSTCAHGFTKEKTVVETSTPPKNDESNFDIVKATQYGAFERIQHLINNENVDVNARDSENVTLMHWAAINNRVEICKFFLSKNATVDAIGGELRSTPLHWATRQGIIFNFFRIGL